MRAGLVLIAIAGALVLPASAWAGRLIVTGHDADRRCALLDQQCGFLKAAVRYVRETAPATSKPVLVLDRGPKQLVRALRKAWTSGYSYRGPRLRVVDPRSRPFRRLPLDVTRFSAIAIASDSSCGGCDLGPLDAAAIRERRRDIQRFFSSGGGVYAGAGGSNSRAYYGFMPIPPAGPASSGPFELTPYGRRIGFKLADLTCCAVANTFQSPDVGALAVAAQNANKVSDTLIADGVVRRGRLVATTTIPASRGSSFVVEPVSGTVLGHPPDDPNFRRIIGAANLVMGWTLDVTKGRARLTTAADARGRQQSVESYEGFFTILQQSGSALTDLVLRSGNFDAVCGSGGVDIARAAQNRKVVRRLWANGKGRFRTKGRFATAAIRGTIWRTDDRCDGTLITVRQGAVTVFDEVARRTVVVRAGRSYLAAAP